ncbi:glycoside hydrolase [Rhodohalobacter sp. 8-1]|uniref:glycoside hydrolase n=1 Tax=Rhodohalobacter sp. 8-1 TaxID=3131972 RepID=UPI0030EC4504
MFKINQCLVAALLLLIMIGCGSSDVQESVNEDTLVLTVDLENRHQTVHNFGASDAWSTQFVGKNWPLEKREQIADLLFSSELDSDGNPMGIGLSAWRFNIGAGSARQGDESGISDPWRRSESFLTADSTYDWNRQQGQQWFLEAADQRGVETLIGFVNSSPVLLTKNGKAFGDGSGNANISPEHYDDFADYLARIGQYFDENGTPLSYISPVNEPQWDWSEGNGQEGSPYQNEEIASVVSALDEKIREYGLNTQIEIPETAQIDYLYDGNLEGRSDQTEFFFGDESRVKALTSIKPKMAAHSYFTTYPVNEMIEKRRSVWDDIQQTDSDLEYWMTEFCVLGDVGDGLQGSGRDLGIDPALYVARVMHYDLTIANASAWQWWLGVSPYDYKDGLVYIDHNMNDGQVYDSKILWAMGNFSRFIRPGAVRVGMSRSDQLSPEESADQVMASAYVHPESGQFVSVIINNGNQPSDLFLNFEDVDEQNLSAITPYLTSGNSDLSKLPSVSYGDALSVPARSVITLTADIEL